MKAMTGAELRTARERLSLTQTWMAERFKVTHRAFQYWEKDERQKIPEDVGEQTLDLQRKADRAAWKMLTVISEYIDRKGIKAAMITLVRYQQDKDLWHYRPDMKDMPASFFGGILGRVERELKASGIEVHIIYMNAEKYEAWLQSHKREDSEENRLEWAAEEYRARIYDHG